MFPITYIIEEVAFVLHSVMLFCMLLWVGKKLDNIAKRLEK